MSGRAILIAVSMIDRDVIERLASLLGGHVYGPRDRSHVKPTHQPIWTAHLKGPGAAAWMMTIYPLLGRRRRSQVALALRRWRAMKYVRISPATERSIIEAWDAGERVKTRLGRHLNVSRNTVYRVLLDNQRIERFREASVTITPIDIAWLAGLIEGEGNISINGRSLTLRIKMGDRDVISRAADLLGGKVYAATVSDPKGQPMWLAQVKSSTAAGWIMTIYPWLGARRRQQARDALAFWRRQGHGAIAESLAAAILSYRKARFSQAEIMAILKVSKSTVYRHTRDKVRRMRVTAHHGRPHQVRERPRSYNAGLAYLRIA